MTTLYKNQAFTIAHADDGTFEGQGLRPFFEYRQLGIKEATKGKFAAHVIRAVSARDHVGWASAHHASAQVRSEWWAEAHPTPVFEYEGEGEHILRAGSSVLQPPGIRHREVRHSDDLELLEIVSPAEFATHDAEAPA